MSKLHEQYTALVEQRDEIDGLISDLEKKLSKECPFAVGTKFVNNTEINVAEEWMSTPIWKEQTLHATMWGASFGGELGRFHILCYGERTGQTDGQVDFYSYPDGTFSDGWELAK